MAMFATKTQEEFKNACRSGHVVCCTSYTVGDTLTVGRPFICAYIHHIVILAANCFYELLSQCRVMNCCR